jgi:hypothetical protein
MSAPYDEDFDTFAAGGCGLPRTKKMIGKARRHFAVVARTLRFVAGNNQNEGVAGCEATHEALWDWWFLVDSFNNLVFRIGVEQNTVQVHC